MDPPLETGSCSATRGSWCEVESDAQRYGDEFLVGFGKTGRDGMHLRAVTVRESCDLVISNVVVIDPVLGVRKASIGVTRRTHLAASAVPETPTRSTGWTSSWARTPRS